MRKAGDELVPDAVDSCQAFSDHVRGVEAAVIHTYQITAYRAVREPDPGDAAKHWKQMVEFCENALVVTAALRAKFPTCGTPELYNLALKYRAEAEKRFHQNLRDSEVGSPPDGLFPEELTLTTDKNE